MIIPHRVHAKFDAENLLSISGVAPALMLAQSAGLHDHLGAALGVNSPNATVKASGVIMGMVAGAKSVQGLDILRHGGTGKVFNDLRAPSTYGTFLRKFNHGFVQQLKAAGRRILVGLTTNTPAMLAGATNPDGIAFIDVDDTIKATYGYQKQATSYGYNGVKGANIQVGIVSTPLASPVVLGADLRKGSTKSGKAGGRFLATAINTAREAGVCSQIMARADSAYFNSDFIGAAVRAGVWFSVTARMASNVTAAIASISEDGWTPIQYPNAIEEKNPDGTTYLVSDAEVAEIPFVAFTSLRKSLHVPCRLVMRRVKRLQRLESDGSVQGELFATWRHHAFVTNSTLTTVDADARHRDHAIIEQTICELKNGPLATLPSGRYGANAAWVAFAAIAFNVVRAAGVEAGMTHARWATLELALFRVPAQIVTSGRQMYFRLPTRWPWQTAWENLNSAAHRAPRRKILTT